MVVDGAVSGDRIVPIYPLTEGLTDRWLRALTFRTVDANCRQLQDALPVSLRKAHGRAFDRAFLQHEVDYHNAVIDAVNKTLLPAIQNAQVKDLVTKVAPAFVAHRDAAQNLLNEQK